MGRFSLHPGCPERKKRQDEIIELHSKTIEKVIETAFDPEAGKPTDNPFPEELNNYNSLSLAELKAICIERELAVSGTKSVLVNRLNESDSPEAPVEETAVEEEQVAPEESAAVEEGEVSESGEDNGESSAK